MSIQRWFGSLCLTTATCHTCKLFLKSVFSIKIPYTMKEWSSPQVHCRDKQTYQFQEWARASFCGCNLSLPFGYDCLVFAALLCGILSLWSKSGWGLAICHVLMNDPINQDTESALNSSDNKFVWFASEKLHNSEGNESRHQWSIVCHWFGAGCPHGSQQLWSITIAHKSLYLL